jgi:hypothetical protein
LTLINLALLVTSCAGARRQGASAVFGHHTRQGPRNCRFGRRSRQHLGTSAEKLRTAPSRDRAVVPSPEGRPVVKISSSRMAAAWRSQPVKASPTPSSSPRRRSETRYRRQEWQAAVDCALNAHLGLGGVNTFGVACCKSILTG